MRIALRLLAGIASLACAQGQSAVANVARSAHFRYDESAGTCRDGAGNTGYDETTLSALIPSHDGECVSFTKSALTSLNDLGDFVSFEGWNLRGADLGSATLMYTRLLDADLSGADLGELRHFYYCLRGRVDRYTQLPAELTATGDAIDAGDSCP
ncbi:MAG: pentapeptide repeat-containing protein [Myxococcales bacterium]|nr:pentapeptide repeat-containing protein [Myxococcales bacterium]